jgi:hypothetical protein
MKRVYLGEYPSKPKVDCTDDECGAEDKSEKDDGITVD